MSRDRPVRVVIAYDMSTEADRAVAIVAGVQWPAGSTVRVVTSTSGIGTGLSSFATPGELRAHGRDLHASIAAAHEPAVAHLAATGAFVETAVVTGRPGRAVVRDARSVDADLIVAGARSQHPLAATVLGSVSTEITEHARCPVLIVRVQSFERVVLATDGSPAAGAATDLVARLPLFALSEVRVVQVVPSDSHSAGLLLSRDDLGDLDDEVAATRDRARDELASAVDRLVGDGRRAHGQLRGGNPADELAAAVREWPADVVVLGSTGKSMIRRLMLGGVARSVLQGVPSSVVIVPPRLMADAAAARR
jgi:nucleotide-binding universal stress UspA family protein